MTINNFKTGPDGIKLIKEIEKLELHAYQKTINGVKDKITIGYGHTGMLNGRPLTLNDTITKFEAEQLFKNDLSAFERIINESVRVKINQNQFDALMSLSYNIGANAFKNSTLLKLLNKGDFTGARNQFYRWNKSGGKDSLGLTRRRAKEADLFNKPITKVPNPSKSNVGQNGYSTSKTTPKTAKDFYNPNTQKVNYDITPKGSNYSNNFSDGGGSKQPPIVLQPQNKNNHPSTPNNKIISVVLINAPTRGSIGILPTNNTAGQTLYYEMNTYAQFYSPEMTGTKGSITGPASSVSTSESASSLYVSNVGGSNFWQSTANSVKSVAKDLISTAAWAANIYFMGVQFASLLKLLVKGTLSAKERLRIGFFSIISNVFSWLFRW